VTSSIAHQVYTRVRKFDTLATNLINPTPYSELPTYVRGAMEHETTNEPITREKYFEILKYNLKRDVQIREPGIIIQPYLFWVAASPDGPVK